MFCCARFDCKHCLRLYASLPVIISFCRLEQPLRSILDYQEYGRPRQTPGNRQEAAQSGQDTATVAEAAANVLRREINALDEKLYTQLYDLGNARNDDAREHSERVVEFLSQSVSEIRERFRDTLSALLSSSESADTNISSEGASAVHSRAAETCASRLPRDAQKWIYVFMGRMLHKLGVYDQWQIVPFFKGRGGSGKSTVAQIVKHFFEASDVGILSNNSEKKFGLQSLLNKLIWLCLELKKNVSLDQAEFQSMVSGEDLCVAIKNQVARQTTWSAPGLLCGNESPSWIDAQGSIARRMAIITFAFSVQERDAQPDLLRRILQKELSKLIVKCNVAYRISCEQHKGADIWNILPPYFKSERLRFQTDTDAVYATVFDSGAYELYQRSTTQSEQREDWYVRLDHLEASYRLKWRDLMATSFPDPFTPEKYASAFESAGITVSGEAKLCPDLNALREGPWAVGIRTRQQTSTTSHRSHAF